MIRPAFFLIKLFIILTFFIIKSISVYVFPQINRMGFYAIHINVFFQKIKKNIKAHLYFI